MSPKRRRIAKARRFTSPIIVPGTYTALVDGCPFIDRDAADAGASIVVDAWLLPVEAQSALWDRPIVQYGGRRFVRMPTLDSQNDAVRVDPDDTCTLLDPDDPAAVAMRHPEARHE